MVQAWEVMGEPIIHWQGKFPILKDIMSLKPVFWINPELENIEKISDFPVNKDDILEAEKRWKRFAPFLQKMFTETEETGGIIESPLRPIPKMKSRLENDYQMEITSSLYLKCDNELPIAGSIKARGGIYEVLKHAEDLALKNKMITKNDSYVKFADTEFKKFFGEYSIGVGSTGNLGLSIGIISAALGFNVNVHMSSDAKQWKKNLLREKGVSVIEYEADFSKAISEGRQQSTHAPKSYFVDDEDSRDLFLGYSVAALRLKEQLEQNGTKVDEKHPLFVYLPCGVGGSPGGITFGLKHVFGDNVHCFFVEPTHSPAVLIGLLTGEHEKVSVQDFGLDNHTEADGLAVGTPSSFATGISEKLISGIYTIEDDELFQLLTMLMDLEDLKIEPSAASGLHGPFQLIKQTNYIENHNLTKWMSQATHIAWATGGSLVPKEDMKRFYEKGKEIMAK